MVERCKVCGMVIRQEYVGYNDEKTQHVYKCAACYGLNYSDKAPVKPEKKDKK